MKNRMQEKVLLLLSFTFILNECTYESTCPVVEGWGTFELIETSKDLFGNLNDNDKAVFLDSTGVEIHYTLSRIDRYYERNFNCDHDGNGIINSGDPLVFNTQLQSYSIQYYSSDFYNMHLNLSVGVPSDFDPLTKDNFENNIFDRLTLGIDAYYYQPAMIWIVDKRNGPEPSSQYKVHYSEELTLGTKSFSHVYWDDKLLSNGYSKYIIYFNQEFGVIGVKQAENGSLIYFDHFE